MTILLRDDDKAELTKTMSWPTVYTRVWAGKWTDKNGKIEITSNHAMWLKSTAGKRLLGEIQTARSCTAAKGKLVCDPLSADQLKKRGHRIFELWPSPALVFIKQAR